MQNYVDQNLPTAFRRILRRLLVICLRQSMLQGASLCLTAFAAGLRFCAGGLLPFVVHAAAHQHRADCQCGDPKALFSMFHSKRSPFRKIEEGQRF